MDKKNTGAASAVAREAYEAKVGLEAMARAGRNPNLKGIVHEVLVKDTLNANPTNFLSGTKAVLTKSTTAVRDDVLLMNGGKVLGRMQLKDTPASIAHTVGQVKAGHYAGTNLVGTKETAAAYSEAIKKAAANGVKVTQKMSSSGVSSADTARIAAKTIGVTAGKLSISALGRAASSSGVAGGLLSGGMTAVSSGVKLARGEIDGSEFVGTVAKEAAGGALTAAAATTAGTLVSTAAATVLATTAAPVWVPAAITLATAAAVGTVVKGIWDSLFD